MSSRKIYCAIDETNLDRALSIAHAMQNAKCGLKIGLEFFNAHGPQGVKKIKEACPQSSIFLDMKYHDIPNTVSGALKAITPLGVDFVNIHAAGGYEMMCAAKNTLLEEASRLEIQPPKLLAVTILTSLNEDSLKRIGYQCDLTEQVKKMALLTQEAGLDGVVCSAKEINTLREYCGKEFTLMVPGIRPAGAQQDDQKRVMTPQQAYAAGANHLVIGRPITKAQNPQKAAEEILASL